MEGGMGMSAIAQLQHVWTFDDLQALPEDVDWRCYEIVDGALVVSPSTAFRHEVVCQLLRTVLWDACRPEFLVAGPMALDIHPSYLIPDIVVVRDELRKTNLNPLPAAEIQIAIEVVSPGSRTMDRITKPAEYARAGIPLYLLVETEPIVTLGAYVLAEGASAYTELGTWGPGETAHLDAPFAVDIPIDAITP
jgi:Uma2 family endonuclease